MEIKTQRTAKGVTIAMAGNFDFRARTVFRNAFKDLPATTAFVLDFSRVETIDSSGIGMLLMLREHAGATDSDITIANSNLTVRKVLQMVQCDLLFKIQ